MKETADLKFRPTWQPVMLAGGLSLVVYTVTAATDLSWAGYSADGGELITAAVTGGVPHPPGYPLYTLLGYLLGQIPSALPVARLFNLFSAACMAVAAAGAAATAARYQPRPAGGAAAAGLLFAFSPLVWQQAVVAEVYALHAACLSWGIYFATGGRRPAAASLLMGLAVTAHVTAVLALPFLLINFSRHQWRQLLPALLLPQALWLAPALLALGSSPVVWGDPTIMRGWLWLVTGELYRPNLFALAGEQIPGRLAAVFAPSLSWRGIGAAAWLLLLPPLFNPERRRQSLPTVLTALLFLLFAAGYDSRDGAVLALPALLLLAPLTVWAVSFVRNGALVWPLFLVLLNFVPLYQQRLPAVRQEALDLLGGVPPKSLVITDGRDETIFTLWYFHHVESFRPDIRLVDANMLAFDWYRSRLRTLYPELYPLEEDDLDRLVAAQNDLRPVCFVSLNPGRVTCTPDS